MLTVTFHLSGLNLDCEPSERRSHQRWQFITVTLKDEGRLQFGGQRE